MNVEQYKYLIWSFEHGAWWRPARAGYTKLIMQAGLYRHNEALDICRRANEYLPREQDPHEAMVPAPDWLILALARR